MSTTPYKATPQQWEDAEYYADPDRKPRPVGEYACLLELRARVEALEAAQPAPVVPLATASAGSLVEWVVDAITDSAAAYGPADEPARAAIRAVAAWLRRGRMLHAAELLKQEADR